MTNLNLTWSFIFGCCLLAGAGCGSSGGTKIDPNALIVHGYVINPDSSIVKQAEVRSDPPSVVTFTDTTGYFRVEQNLLERPYVFTATGAFSGQTTVTPERGVSRFVYIMMGEEIDFDELRRDAGEIEIQRGTKGEIHIVIKN